MNQKKVEEVSHKLAYVEAELFVKHYWLLNDEPAAAYEAISQIEAPVMIDFRERIDTAISIIQDGYTSDVLHMIIQDPYESDALHEEAADLLTHLEEAGFLEGELVLPELDAEADYPCLIDLNAADDGNDRNCMDELLAAEIVYELKDNYICKLLKRKPVKQELTEDLCPDLGSIDDYEWDDEDETDDCNTEVIQLVSDPDFEAYLAEQRKKQTNV